MAAVEQKVKQIIVEQLGVDESQVEANASFVDDLQGRSRIHRKQNHQEVGAFITQGDSSCREE